MCGCIVPDVVKDDCCQRKNVHTLLIVFDNRFDQKAMHNSEQLLIFSFLFYFAICYTGPQWGIIAQLSKMHRFVFNIKLMYNAYNNDKRVIFGISIQKSVRSVYKI